MSSALKARLAAALTATAAMALLLLPAAAQAAQVFGSDLLHQPNQADCAELSGPCTIAAAVEVPAEGQLTSAGAPGDGVITSFRVRAKVEAPTPATLRVAGVSPEGQPPNTATATATGTGPTVTLQIAGDEAPPQEFSARLPVKKGQHLGLEGTGLVATYDSSGSRFSYAFAPALVNGMAAKSNEFLGELLVQATVEPDADGDGFGDETQDQCPTQRTSQGACDLTKPKVSNLEVSRGRVSYRLSEAAGVRFTLALKKHGHFRRVGRGFAGKGNAGLDRVAIPGARRLAAGAYRLTMTATDAAGNRAVRTIGFLVRKRR